MAGLAKDLAKKTRLLAFEAKKRGAREAKEAEEARRKAERLATQQSFEEDISGDEDSNISDVTLVTPADSSLRELPVHQAS